MNGILSLLRKYFMYVLFGMVCLSVFIFFGRKFYLSELEINNFKKIVVNGRLIQLKDLQRGTSRIGIQQGDSVVSIGNLRINYDVHEYNIQVGDSISKNANSDTLSFFKLENGVYKKRCDVKF